MRFILAARFRKLCLILAFSWPIVSPQVHSLKWLSFVTRYGSDIERLLAIVKSQFNGH
jgi:hypothetical protein